MKLELPKGFKKVRNEKPKLFELVKGVKIDKDKEHIFKPKKKVVNTEEPTESLKELEMKLRLGGTSNNYMEKIMEITNKLK